ncbi:hypothetical protein AOC36_09560 [Erysipelothrix larvae]|uniref:Phage capsid-like C-terminal domain-containing protein n=1 Tax=Erysipelothrix larvae TaxID=1514105 RepID=A0A0X8H1D3_9FIRM|nr:phage major capsid protein [Erysipelothrix larvae]AMC94220.1 hypothetical protein AOC36_09560 [Erysipelothrix larvae]
MDIKIMNLEQVRARKMEIKSQLESGTLEANDALETEIRSLNDREDEILAAAERRTQLLNDVVVRGGVVAQMQPINTHDNLTQENEETVYRSAFLNNIRGVALSEAEHRAFSTAQESARAVVPTVTQNKIIELLEQSAPLLSEIDLLRVAGGITIPVEEPISEASKHAENATITASEDKVIAVNLFGYEVTKLLKASKSITRMSVDAFEDWLVKNLVRSISRKLKKLILFGSGTGEAKGIDKIVWTADNSVTVASAGTLTANNVLSLVGLLPGAYDAGAKWILSKKTLLNDFLPLQDKAKNDLVQIVNGEYHIQGYPVLMDDDVPRGCAYLGNLYEGYKGNMPEEINVVSDFSLTSNNYEFLGAAMFDGTPALEKAFVKLIKASE